MDVYTKNGASHLCGVGWWDVVSRKGADRSPVPELTSLPAATFRAGVSAVRRHTRVLERQISGHVIYN